MIAAILGFVTGLLNIVLDVAKKALIAVVLLILGCIALFVTFSLVLVHVLQ
jgi:hypothetical protein